MGWVTGLGLGVLSSVVPAPEYPATVVGGLNGVVASAMTGDGSAFGVQGVGRVLVHHRRFSLDLSGRAGIITRDLREVSIIGAGLRWSPSVAYARVGILHNHETPWDLLVEQPVGSILGTATGINHRTGAEIALGVRAPIVPELVAGQRLAVFVETSLSAYLEPNGPPLYGNVDVGLTVSLGKARARPTVAVPPAEPAREAAEEQPSSRAAEP